MADLAVNKQAILDEMKVRSEADLYINEVNLKVAQANNDAELVAQFQANIDKINTAFTVLQAEADALVAPVEEVPAN